MGQEPGMIRRDIEDTRERMGNTVDALGYKTDVKSRAKESVTGRVDSVKEKIVGAKDSASDATPSGADVKQGARQAVGLAQENPLGLAVGAVAVGFLAGMLIPSTNVENEKLGPMADQVKDQIKDTGAEALEHGKAVATETASAAVDAAKSTAQEEGQAHAEDLKGTAQDNASAAREGVTGS
jgi:gas vesicle protein